MRNIVIGMVVGSVLGSVLGATVIAPRLERAAIDPLTGEPSATTFARQLPRALLARPSLTLKTAGGFADADPAGPLARRLETQLWAVSNGAFELRLYPPGMLAAAGDVLAAVATGTADAAFAVPDDLVDVAPAMQLFTGIPFGPQPDEFLAWLEQGGGRALLDEINHPRGLHALVCGLLPSSGFGWFRTELHSANDLRGLRVGASGVRADVLQRLGAETIDVVPDELASLVEQSAIDGVIGRQPAADAARGLQTLFKVYYAQGWSQSLTTVLLFVNLRRWEQFSPLQQAQLETVCGDGIRFSLAHGEGAQFAALRELFARSVRLLRTPAGVREAWERAWQQLVQQRNSEDPLHRRTWQSLAAFRANYAVWRDLSRP